MPFAHEDENPAFSILRAIIRHNPILEIWVSLGYLFDDRVY